MTDDEYKRLQSAFIEINRRLEEIEKKNKNLEATTQNLLMKIQSMQYTVTNLISKVG